MCVLHVPWGGVGLLEAHRVELSRAHPSQPNAEYPLRGTPPPPLSVAGNRVINAQTGKAVAIRGLNWCACWQLLGC
jgi:hypothetical protein